MALKLADAGANLIMRKFFNNTGATGGNNLTLKLFCNDITPADTDTASTYTEAAGGGYAAKALTAGDWTLSAVGGIQQAAYAQQQFAFTGPLTTNTTVYGYYVVDADGVLVYSERAPASYTPANNGDTLLITPVFQLSAGTPA